MLPKRTKLFMDGRSQAIRLPEEFRFKGDEVLIQRDGDNVILSPKPTSWDDFFTQTPLPSEDFMEERIDPPPQKRNGFV